MFFYKAYGLTICSEIDLPELNNEGLGTDVVITFGNINSTCENFEERDFGGDSKVRISDKYIYYLLDDMDICRINQGKEIVINQDTELDKSFLRVIILGPVLSILLHQRDNLVLHAGAVNINGGAVAFLGNNGSGKSTSIFALYNKGYPFVTDDSLPVTFNESDSPVVIPSYSRLKLRPDIITGLQGNLNIVSKTHKYSQKYSYYAKNNFSHNQLPLKKIYIIEKGEYWDLKSLKPTDSLIRLIKSSYCYGIFNKAEVSKNLINCSKIVKNLPIKLLKTHHSLEQLPELIKIIEQDNQN